jgi:hypothetical protein
MSSPYSNATRTVDGTRFAIHTNLSRPSIDEKLWDAKRNSKFNKLYLTGALGLHGYQQRAPLNIGRGLAIAMGELLRCDNRIWERVEFEHCTGEVDVVVATGMATDRVQTFGFSEVNLDPPTFCALATGLKFSTSVTELRFRRCGLSEAIALIGDGLRGNQTTQSLTLEQCGLVDVELAALVSALRDCGSLQKLSLEGNMCRSLAMSELATLLRSKTLQNLSLHNQRIEGEEVLDISPLVGPLMDGNSSLRFLDLSRNSLGDDDVTLLVTALLDNTTLETLHLDQNLITDHGAKVIADGLPSFRVMKTLALPENSFGEEGASAILSAMKDNFHLETVIIPSGISQIQRQIRWYGNLNKGGRRLFSTPRDAALSLYPLVIERVDNMRLAHDWNPSNAPADVIYGLLRLGPILFEQTERRDDS